MLKHAFLLIRRGCHFRGCSFREAAANNDQKKMESLISACKSPDLLGSYLYSACLYGRVMMANRILLCKNVNINWGLMGACRGGNSGLVTHFTGRGANNWNGGLVAAVKGGHRAIVQTMLNYGADANVGIAIACSDKKYGIARMLLDCNAMCPNRECECLYDEWLG